jgi:hypothetical protein
MSMSSMDMTMNSMPTQSSTSMNMKQLNVTEEMLENDSSNWVFRTLPGRTVVLLNCVLLAANKYVFGEHFLTLIAHFTIAGQLFWTCDSSRVFHGGFSLLPAVDVETSQIGTTRPNFYGAPRSRTLSYDPQAVWDLFDGRNWNWNRR